MTLSYLDEIQNRFFVPFTDLDTLCKDISWDSFQPHEYVSNNAFYGIDMALKNYVGLPINYHLKAHYSHISNASLSSPHAKNFDIPHRNNSNVDPQLSIWIKDYDTLPMLFTWAPSHEKIYKKVCRKPMHSIGPIIHYAQNAYTEEQIAAEKKRLGRNALFFPAHSSHLVQTSFSLEESLDYLNTIKKDFDTIRISVYWKDYLDGLHAAYTSSGYECVTAGHMFDPFFLPRLKALLSVTDHTFGISYGTNIAYSIYMQKPFTLKKQEDYSDFSEHPDPINEAKKAVECRKNTLQFLQYFETYNTEISSAQYNLCNHHFGYDQVRSRDELLTLIKSSEEFFNAIIKKSL